MKSIHDCDNKKQAIRFLKKNVRDWGKVKADCKYSEHGDDAETCDACSCDDATKAGPAEWHGVTKKGRQVFVCETCYRLAFDPLADLIDEVEGATGRQEEQEPRRV